MPAVASDYFTIPVRFDPDSGQSGDVTLAVITAAFTAAGIPHSVEINNGFRHPKTNELLHANLKVHKDYVDQANAILATTFGVFQKGPPMPDPLWGAVVTDFSGSAVMTGGDGDPGDFMSVGLLRHLMYPVNDYFVPAYVPAVSASTQSNIPVPGTTVLTGVPTGTNPGLPLFGVTLLLDALALSKVGGLPQTNKAYLQTTLNFNLDGKAKTIVTPKFPIIAKSLDSESVEFWFYVSDKLDLYQARGDRSTATFEELGDPDFYAGTTQADIDTWKKLWVPNPARSYEQAIAAGKWVDEV